MDDFFHYLSFPYLLQGMGVTLQLTAMGFFGGGLLGLVLAAMLLSRFRAVAGIARVYTTLYRGTPLILQLVFAFTVLPYAGIILTPILAGGLALTMNEACFFAEIYRSAILGVDEGQKNAGRALGMTPGVLMVRVTGPQAFRGMVPALGNEAVSTMKNSALASVISVSELTLRTQQLASSTFDYFSIYFATAVMYLVLTGLLTAIQMLVEALVNPQRKSLGLRRFLPWATRQAPELAAPAVPALATEPILNPRPLPHSGRTQADPPPRSFGEAMIEARDLHKAYGSREVLRGIDLTIAQGEVVALLGPSGSGKSTLLRTINHLDGLNGGSVNVGGMSIGYQWDGAELPERKVARQRVQAGVGMVFQSFNLFTHLSVRENVAGPLRWVHGLSRAEAAERADAELARVGLTDWADSFPAQLSGGQQQRVGIARALAPQPKVLLLDEPTSALDPERVAEVLAVITHLATESGLTMVIATHQLRFAREVADRVVLIADGVVAEQGPPERVLGDPQHEVTKRFVQAMNLAEV